VDIDPKRRKASSIEGGAGTDAGAPAATAAARSVA
jgi:hypothetical protein